MEVHVKDGLPTVRAGVIDDAESALVDALPLGQDARHAEYVTYQSLVFSFKLVNRFDMPVRHDQNVSRRDGMQIAEGGHLRVAVDDRGGRPLRQ